MKIFSNTLLWCLCVLLCAWHTLNNTQHTLKLQKHGKRWLKRDGDARMNIANQCMELHLKWNLGILAYSHCTRSIITAIDCWLPIYRPSQIIYFQCDYKWKHLNLICTIYDRRRTILLGRVHSIKAFASIGVCVCYVGSWRPSAKGVRSGQKIKSKSVWIIYSVRYTNELHYDKSGTCTALAVLYPIPTHLIPIPFHSCFLAFHHITFV